MDYPAFSAHHPKPIRKIVHKHDLAVNVQKRRSRNRERFFKYFDTQDFYDHEHYQPHDQQVYDDESIDSFDDFDYIDEFEIRNSLFEFERIMSKPWLYYDAFLTPIGYYRI